MSDAMVRAGLTLAAILIVGAMVHLAAILMLPRFAPADAFSRVAAIAQPGILTVLPPVSGDAGPVPFRDPALASAVCRYDLEQGPLRVGAVLSGQSFVAVSFHSRYGTPFYGLTDRAGNDGKIDVVLMTPSQIEEAEANDPPDQPARVVRVPAPGTTGFVEFDVLARVGGLPLAARELRSMSCKVEGRP